MLVKLTDEQAEVYLDGRLERRGTTVKDLIPGEYRVLARLGGVMSRVHRVVVKPGADVTVTIDLAFDDVIRSSPFAGFEFATASERERSEAGYAAAFANAIDGRAVVVVGIDQVRGRPAIVGSLVELMNGRETRRASIALEPAPARERLAALARFLAGEEPSPEIEVQLDGAAPPRPDLAAVGPEGGAGRWGGWTWITGGAALVALGTGAVLLALDGNCPGSSTDPNCPDVYSTAAPGWIAVGGGVVLAGVTAYLIVSNRPARPRKTAYVAPTAGGAMAGVAFTF